MRNVLNLIAFLFLLLTSVPTAIADDTLVTVPQGRIAEIERRLIHLEARQNGELAVPVGTVVAFFGDEIPFGWLLCDGRALPPGYSELQALVGENLPDLRGMFLRGRTDGRELGSYQPDALIEHAHLVLSPTKARTSSRLSAQRSIAASGISGEVEDYELRGSGLPPSRGQTSETGNAQETRPKNIAVHWIIKY
ncbi:MAG: phage tail protein [Pseudomonadota bacterium]|nr:phage tail protein [Pseudomonadota bacterium]